MRDVLTHRGPDGSGEHEISCDAGDRSLHGWLGHRRLRVIDLTEAAHQPMVSDDGRLALTYNGEIYNFRELRRELEGRGHRFRSSGDTEVILRGYEQWGDDVIRRIDGMFALGIWDGRAGRLLLARDRTGKKPLYYTVQDGRLAFGSEIKSLLALPWVDSGPDMDRLAEFLVFGYVPHPRTFCRGIAQVPPAHTLVYDARGPHAPRRYWSWGEGGPSSPGAPPSAREVPGRVRELLTEAVRRRMVSDVPLGALLSGGIDSSVVVGLMAEISDEPVHTFSIGFPEDASFDERGYAAMAAERFGTHHTEFAVEVDAVGLLDHLVWHHDGPFADSSAVPTYLVCKLAREHVTVVLNGDGGDEIFAGYDRFKGAMLSRLIPPAAAPPLRALSRLIPRTHGYYSPRKRAERFLELAERPIQDRYQSWISVFAPDRLPEVLGPEARSRADLAAATLAMNVSYAEAAGAPLLDRILYANFANYLPDDLAVKMDRMSMASSLETRSPFLDTSMIDFMARVPAGTKVGLRHVKPVLRRAFWPLLPPEIWNRRKHGFGVPIAHWFRDGLRPLFEDEVLASGARTADLLDRHELRTLWDEHQAKERDHSFRFWTVLTLERWLRGAARELAPPALAVSA
jgi:asparagine synthase (glutamine-hydrolysing)